MVKALLCIEDDDIRQDMRQIIRNLGIEDTGGSSVESSRECVADADMMIVDWNVGRLAPDVLLDLWKNSGHTGPVAILFRSMPPDVQVRLLGDRVIWNVIPYPIDLTRLRGAMINLLVRYSQSVQLNQSIASLRRWVAILTGFVFLMAVALIIMAGAMVM